jgi:hypothetical protein
MGLSIWQRRQPIDPIDRVHESVELQLHLQQWTFLISNYIWVDVSYLNIRYDNTDAPY